MYVRYIWWRLTYILCNVQPSCCCTFEVSEERFYWAEFVLFVAFFFFFLSYNENNSVFFFQQFRLIRSVGTNWLTAHNSFQSHSFETRCRTVSIDLFTVNGTSVAAPEKQCPEFNNFGNFNDFGVTEFECAVCYTYIYIYTSVNVKIAFLSTPTAQTVAYTFHRSAFRIIPRPLRLHLLTRITCLMRQVFEEYDASISRNEKSLDPLARSPP